MAIRRVIDLPDLGSEPSYEDNKFKGSKFEISYLSDDERMIYASRSVACSTLVSAIASTIVANSMLKFDSGLSATDGLWLSGDFITNKQTGASLYDAELNFENIKINANDLTSQSVSQTTIQSGDNAKIIVNGTTGIVSLSEGAQAEKTTSNPKSIVNVEALENRVNELYNKISADLLNGTLSVLNKDTTLDFPLLGIIYLDHTIDSDSWKEAGSTIDLTQYRQLAEAIEKTPTLLLNVNGWKYEKAGNSLKLPSTEWFFQCIGENDTQGTRFISHGLPDITGTIGVNPHSYSGAFRSNGSCNGEGDQHKNAARYLQFKASYSSNVYSSEVNTVQPNAVKMHVYFYVGKKSS